jgi:hypothetical protein
LFVRLFEDIEALEDFTVPLTDAFKDLPGNFHLLPRDHSAFRIFPQITQ